MYFEIGVGQQEPCKSRDLSTVRERLGVQLPGPTRHRDGFAVWAKRLEEGTYAMPFGDEPERRREITAQELGALLSGIDLSVARRRKRYQRKSAEAA